MFFRSDQKVWWRRPLGAAVLSLGVLCFLSGYLGASWQQILIFTVIDPAGSPEAMETLIRAHSGSLPIAVVAFLVAHGVDWIVISRLVSGCTFAFAGITFLLTAYSLTREAALSMLIAVVALVYPLSYGTGIYDLSVRTGITNAEFGPLVTALAVALFAGRFWRTGFVALGFLPALHIASGAWTLVSVLALLAATKEGRIEIRRVGYLAVPGLLVVAAMVLSTRPAAPSHAAPVDERFVVLAERICFHFATAANVVGRVGLVSLVALLGFLALSGVLLGAFARARVELEQRYAAKAFCALVVVAVATAMALGVLAMYPTTLLGSAAQRVMPLRFFGAFCSVGGVIVLAVLMRTLLDRHRVAPVVIGLAIGAIGLTGVGKVRPMLWLLLIAALVGVAYDLRRRPREAPASSFPYAKASVAIAGLVLLVSTATAMRQAGPSYWRYWKNDPFWAEVHHGRANGTLLAASGMGLAQIVSGRQLTFWTAELGGLPYMPQSGPYFEAGLRDLYGVDLFHAGDAIDCSLRSATEKESWSRRSREEWLALAKRYGFSDVIAPADWPLALDLVATTPVDPRIAAGRPDAPAKWSHYRVE